MRGRAPRLRARPRRDGLEGSYRSLGMRFTGRRAGAYAPRRFRLRLSRQIRRPRAPSSVPLPAARLARDPRVPTGVDAGGAVIRDGRGLLADDVVDRLDRLLVA